MFKSGGPSLDGEKEYWCRRVAKNRNSSNLANDFPGHSRFPIPNGTSKGWGLNAPVLGQIYLSGLNISGFSKFTGSNITAARFDMRMHPGGIV